MNWARSARYLPLALAASLIGSILTVLNPGLFWDDWVWFWQSPAQHLTIGRELGVWWAGYVNNFIYGLPNPTISLRFLALGSHIVSAVAIAFSLRRFGVLSGRGAFFVFALVAGSHAAPIRFINSVAFYNLYLALFWVGVAILSLGPQRARFRLLSLPFFFFSFYLNSTLVLYAGVLLVLLIPMISQTLTEDQRNFRFVLNAVPRLARGELNTELLRLAIQYLRRQALFLALPLLFVLHVRLTRQSSVLYDGYNAVGGGNLLTAVPETAAKAYGVFIDYIASSISNLNFNLLAPLLVIYAVAIVAVPGARALQSWRSIALTLIAGVTLAYLGLLPYFVVGKPPVFASFYEARNGLAVVPGFVLLQVGLINFLVRVLQSFAPMLAQITGAVLFALVLSFSTHFNLQAGISLAKDWVMTSAIDNFFTTNRPLVNDYGTILFTDETSGLRIDHRTIWNYEYTGILVGALGNKEHLGMSLAEYTSLPVGTPLLSDHYMKVRYNLDDYDTHSPLMAVRMRNAEPLRPSTAIKLVLNYWRGVDPDEAAAAYVQFRVSEVFREADERLASLRKIVDAVEAYKDDNGSYPVNSTNVLPVQSAFGLIENMTLSSPAEKLSNAFISKLSPKYIARDELVANCSTEHCGYIYNSNGVDYKIIYNGAQDMPYARQAYPDTIDPNRATAYGYWTKEAEAW